MRMHLFTHFRGFRVFRGQPPSPSAFICADLRINLPSSPLLSSSPLSLCGQHPPSLPTFPLKNEKLRIDTYTQTRYPPESIRSED